MPVTPANCVAPIADYGISTSVQGTALLPAAVRGELQRQVAAVVAIRNTPMDKARLLGNIVAQFTEYLCAAENGKMPAEQVELRQQTKRYLQFIVHGMDREQVRARVAQQVNEARAVIDQAGLVDAVLKIVDKLHATDAREIDYLKTDQTAARLTELLAEMRQRRGQFRVDPEEMANFLYDRTRQLQGLTKAFSIQAGPVSDLERQIVALRAQLAAAKDNYNQALAANDAIFRRNGASEQTCVEIREAFHTDCARQARRAERPLLPKEASQIYSQVVDEKCPLLELSAEEKAMVEKTVQYAATEYAARVALLETQYQSICLALITVVLALLVVIHSTVAERLRWLEEKRQHNVRRQVRESTDDFRDWLRRQDWYAWLQGKTRV